jgi:sec-independent protein translocase protein TatA
VFDISPIQIVIVLAIALLIFGPKRLPDLGRNLGKGIRDFKDGITGDDSAAMTTGPMTASAPADRVEEPTAADRRTEAPTPDAATDESRTHASV